MHDLSPGQRFISAVQEERRVRDAVDHILGGPQRPQVHGQAEGPHPAFHGREPFQGDLFVGPAICIDAPDLHGKPPELPKAEGQDMSVIRQRDGGQGHAVGRVRVGSHGLAEHMHHPVAAFPAGDQGVQRPGRRPHDVGAGLIVLRVLQGGEGIAPHGLHQGLRKIVAHVVVLAGKILLADMVEDIVDARHHLVLRQGHRKAGIEDGELRHDLLTEHMADLLMGLMVGDHRAAVHLGAGARHGQDAAHRHDLAVRLLEAGIVFFPGVLAAMDRNGHRLGVVAAGAAAHRQKQVRLMRPGDLHAFPQFIRRGIRHHAPVLGDVFPIVQQKLPHGVVDPVLFDGTAAIDQNDVLPVFRKLLVQTVQRVLSEVQLRRVLITESSKHCVFLHAFLLGDICL